MKLKDTLLKMIKSPLHPAEDWEKEALNIKEGGKKLESFSTLAPEATTLLLPSEV